MKLSSSERIPRVLAHQPADRIGLFEVFWRETAATWCAEVRADFHARVEADPVPTDAAGLAAILRDSVKR